MVASIRNILCPTILSKADENRLKMGAELDGKHYPKDFLKDLDYGMISSVNEYRDEISTFICLILGSYFSSAFSDLHKLLILFVSIPVTPAVAERSLSKLKLTKTHLR